MFKNTIKHFEIKTFVKFFQVASESLTLTSTSFANGLMSCSFTRKNTVSNSKIFDLTGNEWYLLVAIGDVDLSIDVYFFYIPL